MFDKTLALIDNHVKNRTTAALPMYSLVNGVHQTYPNERLYINGGTKQLSSVQHPSGTFLETCTQEQFRDLINRFSLLWFFADYRRVKEHTSFRKIYGYGVRVVNYFDGTNVVPKLCETFPCAVCGILMPVNLTTIDHQKPQIGGELLAILKLFRVLGFTIEGPKGVKGQAFAAYKTYNALFMGIVESRITATAIPHPQSTIVDSGKADRQTLNGAGAVLYSACYNAGDIEDLKKISMHSVINLKPLCLRCNTSKGNSVLGN